MPEISRFFGIVYGETPANNDKIISAEPLRDHMMLLTFASGEERLFDAEILKGEVFESLKNEDIFMNPVIDHGVVTWDNGEIDCAPEFMYENSYKYSGKA